MPTYENKNENNLIENNFDKNKPHIKNLDKINFLQDGKQEKKIDIEENFFKTNYPENQIISNENQADNKLFLEKKFENSYHKNAIKNLENSYHKNQTDQKEFVIKKEITNQNQSEPEVNFEILNVEYYNNDQPEFDNEIKPLNISELPRKKIDDFIKNSNFQQKTIDIEDPVFFRNKEDEFKNSKIEAKENNIRNNNFGYKENPNKTEEKNNFNDTLNPKFNQKINTKIDIKSYKTNNDIEISSEKKDLDIQDIKINLTEKKSLQEKENNNNFSNESEKENNKKEEKIDENHMVKNNKNSYNIDDGIIENKQEKNTSQITKGTIDRIFYHVNEFKNRTGVGFAKISVTDKFNNKIDLRIELNSKNNLQLEIVTSNDGIKKEIEKNIDSLKKSLEEQKIILAEVKITSQTSQSNLSDGGFSQNQQQDSKQNQANQ
ncbi:MAG: hypothetical protein K2X39_01635, partial [Silvanigrellaceae bacterium]|nr:hypothetical protein [Silvanigrellaceae bacterium]